MNKQTKRSGPWLSVAISALLLSSCNVPTSDAPEASIRSAGNGAVETSGTNVQSGRIQPALFLKEGLVREIIEEPCTLSGGSQSTCYRITVTSEPVDHKAGPWCPANIADSAEEGGIWPEGGVSNDVDGSFIENLDTFYKDDNWKLYEDDGSIRVTDSAEACGAAARPDVDEAYQNYCVQCELSYVDDELTATYVIPIEPVKLDAPSSLPRAAIGVAFNGVNFDPPAPTEAILGAYTLAPFDDCGGHVNLNGGYHYHAHTGCPTEVAQDDGHAPLIGYMLDGFPLYARLDEAGNEPQNLDQCGGEFDEVRGYHYHAGDPGANQLINCFQGESGCQLDGDADGELCDATAMEERRGGPGGGQGRPGGGPPVDGPPGGGPGGGTPPGFDAAAAELGVSLEELMEALGEPPFELDAAAEKLGVTVDELKNILPEPPR